MTTLVKIETTQLETVVNESGLAIQEGEEIKKSYLPFLTQLAEIQSQATKINFDSPAEIDETIARELRLKTVKIRTGSKDLKDERKKGYLLRGNLEQAAYNLIEASCKLTEDVFVNVEKAREIAEKKRKEQLRIERSEKLLEFITAESMYLYALAEMSEEQFNATYDGLKMAHEKKIAEEKKVEEERLAAVEAERVKNEQIRLENEKLKKEAEAKAKELEVEREKIRKDNEEKERLAEIERKKNVEILKAQQEKADKERAELLKKADEERKEKERLAEIERKKNVEILKAQQEKADKERAELLKKADEERKEKERLAKEIEDKKMADEKAKTELLKKLEAEKKAKIAEEKKAKLAPDKTKLLNLMQLINDLPRPEVKSIEAAEIVSQVNGLLVKVSNFIKEKTNNL